MNQSEQSFALLAGSLARTRCIAIGLEQVKYRKGEQEDCETVPHPPPTVGLRSAGCWLLAAAGCWLSGGAGDSGSMSRGTGGLTDSTEEAR